LLSWGVLHYLHHRTKLQPVQTDQPVSGVSVLRVAMSNMAFIPGLSPSPFPQFSPSPSQCLFSLASSPSWVEQKKLLENMQQQNVPAALIEAMLASMQQQVMQLTELVRADRVNQAALGARIDLLVAAAAQPAEPPKTVWKCPVCCVVLSHMRSFKGHVKRLYEFYHEQPRGRGAVVPHAQHRCQLLVTSKRHLNLVSLSGPAGSLFPARSQAFANVLWQWAQSLTSSDEDVGYIVNDDIEGGGAVMVGSAPPNDEAGEAP
jgi:hypothetical protein